jgi:hypothetical protein
MRSELPNLNSVVEDQVGFDTGVCEEIYRRIPAADRSVLGHPSSSTIKQLGRSFYERGSATTLYRS